MTYKSLSSALTMCACSAVVLLITGCSANFQPSPVGDEEMGQTPVGAIQGSIHGGQAPVANGKIYLFEVGTSGYGGPSKSLITSGYAGCSAGTSDAGASFSGLTAACYVLTDAKGNFALSGDYTCDVGRQVYMVGMGGNAGFGTNSHIVQMAGLGQCPAAQNLAAQDPFVLLNEVTTVAFAYSMAGFGSDAFDISTDAAGSSAIQSAMANATNIINIAQGMVPATTQATGSSGTLPVDKINYLANILATCVNTSGALIVRTGGNNIQQNCYILFNNTGASFTGNNANTATTYDEAQAIFHIAHNPTASVTTLYNLVGSQPVFSSSLTSAQAKDWALPIVYKNAVSTKPGNIAFDSTGNAWISDQSPTAGGVVRITPTGVVKKITGLPSGSIYQVAVDPANVIWAVDNTNSQIYRLDSSGTLQSTLTGTGNNLLQNPVSIAFNTFGNAFVLNASSSFISKFSSSGTGQTPAAYNQTGFGSLGAPVTLAIDGGGNAFVPENVGCQCMGLLTNGSSNTIAYDDYSGTIDNPSAIAIDSSNNPWHAQSAQNEIIEDPSASTTAANGGYSNHNDQALFDSFTGYYFNVDVTNFFFFLVENATNPTPVTGGGLNKPVSLAFDGSGNLWAANSGTTTISGFNNAGTSLTSTTGIQTGASVGTNGAAPDLAGNLWTVNTDGSVSEILGMATPTATPVYPTHVSQKP